MVKNTTKVYSGSTGLIKSPSGGSQSFLSLGNWSNDLPVQYEVVITDKRPKDYTDVAKYNNEEFVIIRAALQEKITTRTEATWSPLAASAYAQDIYGGLTQYFTNRTLVSTYASRRIWTGSTPLDFTLNLKFEAVNDVSKEVLKPIIELQRMSLPFEGKSREEHPHLTKVFLAPPGPDPYEDFRIGNLIKSIDYKPNQYENITINIGMLMEIKKVIVKDITIQHSLKFDELGRPVEAIATVHFQTFEIITKESLDDIYPQISSTSQTVETENIK